MSPEKSLPLPQRVEDHEVEGDGEEGETHVGHHLDRDAVQHGGGQRGAHLHPPSQQCLTLLPARRRGEVKLTMTTTIKCRHSSPLRDPER